ncbi:WYL domain-containing protein [Aureispira anguillae]|uniref:WYL domain-containing protein n=1 Tax=Aureispira anguillae TaxID=2864201 RepID=A0A916DVJ7_9BACT|nr:WYL domain-containing protein [Aureispira anguillae]BDS13196.1 WYL domain-containing protein [Aureispira anguillae]
MPVNRNALIRYKTIDKCLQNRYRKWTLENLIDACSDALYEYEGIDKGVSKRTVQGDLQIMRSDKLGYNAPIIVVDKRYYTYEDPNYSITNIPLTDQDLGMLTDAVAFMKQFKGFSHFRELDGMVQKLEDHIYAQKTQTKPVIDFEKNDHLKGLEHLDILYKAIIKKQVITITYQSFKARKASSFEFHPYLLKEFRNRWFLIGTKEGANHIMNLALDRIESIAKSDLWYNDQHTFDAETYFKDAIGVSVSPNLPPEEILLYVSRQHAPYVLTKPLHHSQQLVKKDYHSVTISLHVQHNFELEKVILGYGEGIKVLAPKRLRRAIKNRINTSLDSYNTEITERGLQATRQKIKHKGYAVFNRLYTGRELKLIINTLYKNLGKISKEQASSIPHFLKQYPKLKNILFNQNLTRLVHYISPDAFLVKATLFNHAPQAARYQSWHQGGTAEVQSKTTTVASYRLPAAIAAQNFCIRIHLDDIPPNTEQQVLPGSHHQRLSTDEIELISNNSHPYAPDLYAGTVLIMSPLLLTSFKTTNALKKRRVIHLEFSAQALPNELEWFEKLEL